MEWSDTKLAQGLAMIDGRIPAVVLPAVTRVLRRKPGHQPVARDLRDDRCRGDGEGLRVASHDLAVFAWRERGIENAASVDEHPVVLTDLTERAKHRDVARVIDVEAMDLRDLGRADADLHDAAPDRPEELLALETREHLRVVHLADEPGVRRDQARRRDHRPRERGHTDLVDADDAQETIRPEALLVVEGRHGYVVQRTGRGPVKLFVYLRFSRRVAALPTRSRRKYKAARRA